MGVGVGVEEVFDCDLVLPVIAEVIGVVKLVADAADQLAEAHTALVGVTELGVWQAEFLRPAGEHVHVAVLPAERGDDDLVEMIEAGVGAKLQPSPDRRLGHSQQLDLDLHDDLCGLAHWLLLW